MSIVSAKRGLGLLAAFLGALGAVGACSGKTYTQGGSETNWLAMCGHDSDCSVGSCLCGVCTTSCDDAAGCPADLDACANTDTPAFGAMCNASAPKRVCLKGCGSGVVCAKGFTCDGGACVPTAHVDADAGSGGTGSGGATGDGGTSGTLSGQAGSVTTMSGPTTASVFVDELNIMQDVNFVPAKCLPRTLPVDAHGQVACKVVSVSNLSNCQCDGPGLQPLVADQLAAVKERMRESKECDVDTKPFCDTLCGCEVVQESGADLTKCQVSTDVQGVAPGFCYVDPLENPAANPALVENCPPTQKRALRFFGSFQDQTLLLECTFTSVNAAEAFNGTPGNLGDPCIPGDEYNKNFSGYGETEINVESRTSICTTGICLTANFRGRVSCPFGQPAAQSADPATGKILADPNTPPEDRCYVPGTPHVPENLIDVPVPAQLVGRQADKAVYCSCRCDGPAGEGPFCDCPSGFECQKLVDSYGASGGAQLAGSYCIKAGTAVPDPTQLTNTSSCDQLAPAIKNLPPPQGCGPAPAGNGTDGG